MNETQAQELGAQTASEDYAIRGGAPYDAAYLHKLAQQWALRQMYRTGAPVATAKIWEAAFITSYVNTYTLLSQMC